MQLRITLFVLQLFLVASTSFAFNSEPAGCKTLYLAPDRSVTIEMTAAEKGSFNNFMAALQGNLALSRLDTTAQGKPPITLSRRGVPGVMAADLRNSAALAEKKKPAGTSLADVRDIVSRMATAVEDDVRMGRLRITGEGAGENLEIVVTGIVEDRHLYARNSDSPALDIFLATLADPLTPIRSETGSHLKH